MQCHCGADTDFASCWTTQHQAPIGALTASKLHVTAECFTMTTFQLRLHCNFGYMCQNWVQRRLTWPARRIDWLVEVSAQDNIWFAHRLLQGHAHVMQTNQATQFVMH